MDFMYEYQAHLLVGVSIASQITGTVGVSHRQAQQGKVQIPSRHLEGCIC